MRHRIQDGTLLRHMSDQEVLLGQHISDILVRTSTEVMGPGVGQVCECDDGTCHVKVSGSQSSDAPSSASHL
jgi:hypothetical protein